MGTFEKIGLAIVAVAFAATLVLPDRQTADIISAGGKAFGSALKIAEGRG